jgi:hypothetical protein
MGTYQIAAFHFARTLNRSRRNFLKIAAGLFLSVLLSCIETHDVDPRSHDVAFRLMRAFAARQTAAVGASYYFPRTSTAQAEQRSLTAALTAARNSLGEFQSLKENPDDKTWYFVELESADPDHWQNVRGPYETVIGGAAFSSEPDILLRVLLVKHEDEWRLRRFSIGYPRTAESKAKIDAVSQEIFKIFNAETFH